MNHHQQQRAIGQAETFIHQMGMHRGYMTHRTDGSILVMFSSTLVGATNVAIFDGIRARFETEDGKRSSRRSFVKDWQATFTK